MPTNKRKNNEIVVYLHNGTPYNHIAMRKKNLDLYTIWVYLTKIIVIKRNQTQKSRLPSIFILFVPSSEIGKINECGLKSEKWLTVGMEQIVMDRK